MSLALFKGIDHIAATIGIIWYSIKYSESFFLLKKSPKVCSVILFLSNGCISSRPCDLLEFS